MDDVPVNLAVGDRVEIVWVSASLPPQTARSERFNCIKGSRGKVAAIVCNEVGVILVYVIALSENRLARCIRRELAYLPPSESAN